MATVVFSHGFGVQADARGMFTDIADALPEHEYVMFDYNRVLDDSEVEIAPLYNQAKILQQVIDTQDGDVIIIAHSQGCVTAGLIDFENIRKVILLAPPVRLSRQSVIDKLMKKPDAEINLNGMSKLSRSDGTTTLISKEYIKSVSDINPLKVYQQLADTVDTIIVRCTKDEVLGLTDVDTVKHAVHFDIEADHDFTGVAREKLITLIASEL